MDQTTFGQILVEFGVLGSRDVELAVAKQQKEEKPRKLGEILIEDGLLNEKTLRNILSIQKRTIDLEKAHAAEPVTNLKERLENAPLTEYLRFARETRASDFYFSSGSRPLLRLHGNLVDLPMDPPSLDKAKRMIFSLLGPEKEKAYMERRSLNALVQPDGLGRFRVSVFRHLRGIAALFRLILDKPAPIDKLGLPPAVMQFAKLRKGLVLVTGPSGSGKSTTLAALLDLINKTRSAHIITIEDPIEMVIRSEKSLVSQRQVPGHSKTFHSALRSALREDPNVIALGELNDTETISTAITAAETGHLIFGTLHTHTAHRTVLRLLDQFPAEKRAHIRTLLADTLRGVISQHLIPNLDGRGRSLACEVMVSNTAIANLIREDRPWQIPMQMQTGRKQGMQLLDDSLRELIRAKRISLEEAMLRATDRARLAAPEENQS